MARKIILLTHGRTGPRQRSKNHEAAAQRSRPLPETQCRPISADAGALGAIPHRSTVAPRRSSRGGNDRDKLIEGQPDRRTRSRADRRLIRARSHAGYEEQNAALPRADPRARTNCPDPRSSKPRPADAIGRIWPSPPTGGPRSRHQGQGRDPLTSLTSNSSSRRAKRTAACTIFPSSSAHVSPARLEDRNSYREIIMASLSVDKAQRSRASCHCDRVRRPAIEAIGRQAPAFGQLAWKANRTLEREDNRARARFEMVKAPTFRALATDKRFEALVG